MTTVAGVDRPTLRETLRPNAAAWRTLGLTAYISVVAILGSYAISAAAFAGMLIPLAVPIGLGYVLAMAWVPARAQIVGWGVITVWLLSTEYFGTGDQEYVALVAIVVGSVLGVFASPWFLAGIWLAHPLWDFLFVRELPAHLVDLPIACAIYDLVIAAYLMWAILRGRLTAIGAQGAIAFRPGLRNAVIAAYVGGVLLLQILVVTVALDSGTVEWIALPLGAGIVLALFWLSPRAQTLAWVVLTGWMGMTYAHFGEWYEIVVFLVILIIGVLGATTSPWYFVIAWGFHVFWNLLPRAEHVHEAGTMMGHLGMSPTAAILYELPITVYLVIAVVLKLIKPLPALATPPASADRASGEAARA